jgi:tRNA pseudouridine38-40 synthase
MRTHSVEKTDYEPVGRYLMEISYDGSEYSGWQIQPKCLTVQQVVQQTLSKIYAGQYIHVIGSSRTDAGVHAVGFAASFAYPARPMLGKEQLKRAMNSLMPQSVRIRSVKDEVLGFHSRYDAMGKAYTYVINLGEKTPFATKYSWSPKVKLNVDAMREAAVHLIGTHDFSSFTVKRHKIDCAVRTIYDIQFKQFGKYLCVTFIGNGFLYKMIRCMIGALDAVGSGRIKAEDIVAIRDAKDRTASADTAAGCGLFLMKVFYDQDPAEGFELQQVPFFM